MLCENNLHRTDYNRNNRNNLNSVVSKAQFHRRCICSARVVSRLFIGTNMWLLIVAFIYLTLSFNIVNCQELEIDPNKVRNLALRFGKDIAEGSFESTCSRKIKDNFEKLRATTSWVDANKMMEDMRNDVMNMLNWKKVAVERIVNESERLAANHTYDKHLIFDYINAKKIYRDDDRDGDNSDSESKPLKLSPHPNFESAEVNLDHSAVHVPINVFEKSPDIVNDIKWSESLTQFFKNNLAFDPGLSWQFFGSSTGFLRLYPATKWRGPPKDFTSIEVPDLYDCRMRPWYIQGAASPKDIVILLDGSGSMTGLRKEIGRNVIINILDTLTDDDYVAAIRFSKEIEPIAECFNRTLVQANERNVKEIKDSLEKGNTSEIANFSKALVAAFDLLQHYNRSNMGSQCNQAIMLITDGAPSTYEDIFVRYNWPNIPVRVFTYLIGREVTDSKEINWMACHNRGYFTHVVNLAEVREQVQQYVPVMSRPIVLSGERPFMWTPVYSDVSDVQLTDWYWEEREKMERRAKMKKLIREQRERQNSENLEESSVIKSDDDDGHEQEHENETNGPITPSSVEENENVQNTEPEPNKRQQKIKKSVQLMTTLASPVFDTRNFTNITYRILVKNVWQDSEPVQVRTANLLGVAGVDVPIREIVKLTPAYKLGVNGYSFVITNNGYLLYHPDLRPMFQDMLKPFYSSVDMSEVELADNERGPREPDPGIDEIRGNMINRTHGWKKVNVKVHLDSMRRVVTRTNNYIYGKIDHTPFSLAIVLPEPYGPYRVEGQVEVKRKEENFTHFFRGNNWRVHPEWVYCDNPHKMSGIVPQNPEDAIKQFLNIAVNGHTKYRWRTSSTRPQVYGEISCDKDLVQSLVFDAKATDDGLKCETSTLGSGKIEETRFNMFGIVTTFVATRSGLTRYEDHQSDEEKKNANGEHPFIDSHTTATDETFYKRAVDFNRINDSAFVFSVPFDAYDDAKERGEEILVTGSHAIFIGSGKQSAPAAVVGLQLKHSIFEERFFNLTKMPESEIKCQNEELDCYLLDNNAFVIVSEDRTHTGKFFGEIDNLLLNAMVEYKIYRKVHMYDYQAICWHVTGTSAFASTLLTPFKHMKSIITWVWTRIIMLYAQLWFNSWHTDASADYSLNDDEYFYEDRRKGANKTRVRPCDKEFNLYEMRSHPSSEEQTVNGYHSECHTSGCNKKFIVQYVPYTNLIMLVVNNACPCESVPIKLDPTEINYNETERCRHLKTEMYRKRPMTCHNYHPQEKDIKQCGKGTNLVPTVMSFMLTVIHIVIIRYTQ